LIPHPAVTLILTLGGTIAVEDATGRRQQGVPPPHGGAGRWFLAGDRAVQDGMRAVRIGALTEHTEIMTHEPGRQGLLTDEIRYLDRIVVPMVVL
jgi:hypothetical protein